MVMKYFRKTIQLASLALMETTVLERQILVGMMCQRLFETIYPQINQVLPALRDITAFSLLTLTVFCKDLTTLPRILQLPVITLLKELGKK